MFSRLTGAVLTGIVLISLFAGSTMAAENWFIYLYNGVQQELVRVNIVDGSVETFTLGLSEGTHVSGWEMGFSQDGRLAAYCANTPTSDNTGFNTTVHVRDILAQSDIIAFDLGQPVGCSIGRSGFTADGSLVSIGIVNYFPTTVADTGGGKPVWQLLVMDVSNSTIIHELNANMPAVIEAGIPSTTPIMPEVRALDSDTVTFAAMPYGVGGTVSSDVYRWNLGDDTPVFQYTGPRSNPSLTDTLPATGETVWLDYDPTLETVDMIAGPMGRFNVIKMLDNSGTEHVIFHSPDALLGTPRFIAGGEQLAFMVHRFDEQGLLTDSKWITLDRQGSVSELVVDAGFVELVSAPGGYAMFERLLDSTTGYSQFALMYRNIYAGDDSGLLWSSEIEGWEMVWHTSTPLGSNLTPFPTIQ